MKKLILIRHAKSAHSLLDSDDRRRPLNERGLRNAPRMGVELKSRGYAPDLMVTSPALRAMTTAELIAGAMGYSPENIVHDESAYTFSAENLLETVRGLPSADDTVLLVGHNPACHEFVSRMCDIRIGKYVTCGTSVIAYTADSWSRVYWGDGRLECYLRPRDLAELNEALHEPNSQASAHS